MDRIFDDDDGSALKAVTASRDYWQKEAIRARRMAGRLASGAALITAFAVSLSAYIAACDWPARVASAEATAYESQHAADRWHAEADRCIDRCTPCWCFMISPSSWDPAGGNGRAAFDMGVEDFMHCTCD
jgi:hypothetical protein